MQSNSDLHTQTLVDLVHQARGGDRTAWDRLIGHVADRLRCQVRAQLSGNKRVMRWEENDDVLNAVLQKTCDALKDWMPPSTADFFSYTARIIRNHLIDLGRKYYGPEGIGANHHTRPADSSTLDEPMARQSDSSSLDPPTFAQWTEFHEQVGRLPAELRNIFELLFYHQLQKQEVAEMLGIPPRTLYERQLEARRILAPHLPG